jgi:hypothetical protein
LGNSLGARLDVQELLLPLLTELFERVQASTLRCSDAGADPATSLERVEVRYCPVYVDTLMALAEKLVLLVRSGTAVTALQAIWQWLTLFTSARAHRDQAGAAALSQMHSRAAAMDDLLSIDAEPEPAPAPVTGTGALREEGRLAHEAHADAAVLQSVLRAIVLSRQEPFAGSANSVPALVGSSFFSEVAQVNRRSARVVEIKCAFLPVA